MGQEDELAVYTADEAAERLNLHVKTVRRYIREGKLKAKRIGKEYRITRADLEEFSGHRPSFEPPRSRHVMASTIVDVDAISPGESDRITTLLLAALNTRTGEGDPTRLDSIYYPERGRLRIAVTGGIAVTNDLLGTIEMLLEGDHG
jgi:excisionase family DNA binding protein